MKSVEQQMQEHSDRAERHLTQLIASASALETFVSILAEQGRISWREDAPIFWAHVQGVQGAIQEAEEDGF